MRSQGFEFRSGETAFRGFRTACVGLFLALFVHASPARVAAQNGDAAVEGYGVLTPEPGSPAVVATALFRFRNADGVVVSEAAVAGVPPAREGGLIVDQSRSVTGFAWASPADDAQTFRFVLKDLQGQTLGTVDRVLEARGNEALLIGELFSSDLGEDFLGTVSFESLSAGPGAAVVTIRSSRNGRGESILATLPVLPVSAASCAEQVYPQVAAAPGLSTELYLVNPGPDSISGAVRVFWSGEDLQDIPYSIAAGGVMKIVLEEEPSLARQGFVRLMPADGSPCPSGAAVFTYGNAAGLISEAGVQAVRPSRGVRLLLDYRQTLTGVALANPNAAPADVEFVLLNLDGSERGTNTATLSAGGHRALFADELFPEITNLGEGILEVRSSVPVAAVALKLTIDPERGEPIVTTVPVADLEATQGLAAQTLYFPEVVFGGGFDTRFIVLNTDSDRRATATLALFSSDGRPLMEPASTSEFRYRLEPSGGGLFSPAEPAARVAYVIPVPDDPRLLEAHFAVNESFAINPVAVDNQGRIRPEIGVQLSVLDADVATLDGQGSLLGVGVGFTTLFATAEGVVSTLAITVTDPEPIAYTNGGTDGNFDESLFFADDLRHTISFARELGETPEPFCGLEGRPDFTDGECSAARFDSPSNVHLDRANGRLYVSDSGNHAIRVVEDRRLATTLASPAIPASLSQGGAPDGFNDPQGLALDRAGNLWVVDSGDHVVRRVRLSDGRVELLAGTPGQAGSAPSQFSGPRGISFEVESLSLRVARAFDGEPQRPPQMIVADTGNDRLQRVFSDGRVETVLTLGSASTQISAPQAVASDGFGNIYFTEPDRTKIRLPDGNVVSATPTGMAGSPTGVLVVQAGQIVVGEGAAARRITYAPPAIGEVEIADSRLAVGSEITIRGADFAPEAQVIIAGRLITGRSPVADARTLRFAAPPLPSGLGTLTVFHRGGFDQRAFFVPAVPLNAIAPGAITTLAGGSTFAGDGSPAEAASLNGPSALFIDSSRGVYVSDTENHRVRRIDERNTQINTLAGTGRPGLTDEGMPALTTSLDGPRGIKLDEAGNLYIVDTGNGLIWRVDAATGLAAVVVGGGSELEAGPARSISLSFPQGIDVDSDGNLYIADTESRLIRRFDAASGMVTTFAGGGSSTDEGVSACKAGLVRPTDVFLDGEYLYLVDCQLDNGRIRRVRVDPENAGLNCPGDVDRPIETVVGVRAMVSPPSFADQVVDEAFLCPESIWLDGRGGLFIADSDDHRVVKVDLESGTAEELDGFSEADGGVSGGLSFPAGVAVDTSGNVFVSDQDNNRILRRSAGGEVTVFAGIGQSRPLGDGGPAAGALLSSPSAMAADSLGNLYVADSENHRIRRITGPVGAGSEIIDTIVSEVDGDPLSSPQGLAFDGVDSLYFANSGNHSVWRLSLSSSSLTLVAGIKGRPGDSGDGAAPSNALLNYPQGLALDAAGRLLIADSRNHRIRRIDFRSNIIETIAGNGQLGFTGQNGDAAVTARLQFPTGVAADGNGNVFFSDSRNQRIRMVDSAGRIYNIAGGGTELDDAPAAAARFSFPEGLWVDGDRLLIADCGNNRLREIDLSGFDPQSPDLGGLTVRTLAGGSRPSPALNGDGGPASQAQLLEPRGVIIDAAGNLFVSEAVDGRIRAVRGRMDAGSPQ